MPPYLHYLLLLNHIAELLFLLPLATAISRRRNLPPAYRWLYYFYASLLVQWLLRMSGAVVLHNNIFSYYLYTLTEYASFSLVLTQLLSLNRRLHYYLLALVGGMVLLDACWLNGITRDTNSYSMVLANTLLLLFALLVLYRLAGNKRVKSLPQYPHFWLSISVLFYTSASTLMYVLANVSAQNPLVALQVMCIFPIINLLHALLITRMFACFPLSVHPRQALPGWLRFRFGRRLVPLHSPTAPRINQSK